MVHPSFVKFVFGVRHLCDTLCEIGFDPPTSGRGIITWIDLSASSLSKLPLFPYDRGWSSTWIPQHYPVDGTAPQIIIPGILHPFLQGKVGWVKG